MAHFLRTAATMHEMDPKAILEGPMNDLKVEV